MNMQPELILNRRTILVVDDHILFREGLISLLKTTPDFEVIGEAGSVHEAIKEARRLSPEIILMDFSMSDGTGLEATQAILADLPECKIVFLTAYDADKEVMAALRQGASGYLLKNVAVTDLILSLHALNHGELALSRQMMSRAINQFSHNTIISGPKQENNLSKLSPRELDVLAELGDGATNQEIASRLSLSENTVKHHIRSLLEKLEVENRYRAAALGRQNGVTGKFQNSVIKTN
jgi:DNA-binding NarL/FixJ family response regulator